MPVSRYRIAHPLPSRLEYRGAVIALEVVKQRHDTIPVDEWALQARKVGVGTVCIIATALGFRSRLLEALERGFEVETGSPSDRVMARLVREHIAVALPAGRR
jgi:hypothetical protein